MGVKKYGHDLGSKGLATGANKREKKPSVTICIFCSVYVYMFSSFPTWKQIILYLKRKPCDCIEIFLHMCRKKTGKICE